MRNNNRPDLFQVLLPARGRLRVLFVFALACIGLGCLLSVCFVLSIPPEPADDFATLLNVGIVILSPFWGFSALLLLAGAYRQKRPGPRALAWGAMSLLSLLPTIFALSATADNPNSFALCSVVCAPFVLVLIALTFYHWRKVRAELAPAPARPPRTAPPPFSEPVQAHARTPEAQPQVDVSEWATNLNLSGSMADDETTEWLKNLKLQRPPPASVVSQTAIQPAHTNSAIPNAEADLPDWLRALKPADADIPTPPPKPTIPETSVSDAQSSLDQLSQALESSKQALDDLLRSRFPEIGATTPTDTSANQKTGEKKNQCPHCGTELSGAPGQGFVFCYHCGSQVNL